MKSRSYRLPVNQKDDWVEESWTVDCLCGVNFDDGEEMVDCDDCGVWVHTRCSRYVKTDNSFVCDKCKNNDSSEETEVAQLLVELPTKTVRRMDSVPLPSIPSPPCTASSVLTASTRPFKVHVQGVPGDAGDPSLFSGISAVFGPQLWKCSGYIPKKFNFKYREFPCEDEEVLDSKNSGLKIETETDISTDNGAGALLSLSKSDVSFPTPVGVEKQPDDGKGSHKFVSPKQSGRLDNLNSDPLTPKNEVGKNTSFMKPPLLHFEKRKREDLSNVKDRSGKKKARLFVKDGDCSKRIRLRSPDRGHMAAEIDPRCGRGENASYSLPTSHLSHDPVVVDHAVDAQKSNSREKNRHQHPLKLEGISKTAIGASSTLHSNTSGLVPAEEEVACITAVTPDVLGGKLFGSGGTGMQQADQVQEDSAASVSKTDEGGSAPDSSTSFRGIHATSKIELASGSRNVNVKMSSLHGTKLSSSGTSFASQETLSCHSSEIASVTDTAITGSVTHDSKVEDDVRRSEVDLHKQRADGESPLHHCKPGHEGGFDGFLESKKFSPSAAVEHDKSIVTASAANSVIASSAILMLNSSASDNSNMSATGQSDNVDGKQNLVRDSSLNGASTVVFEDEVRHEKARKLIKEHSKSALTCVQKTSQLKKISHAAIVSKKTIHDLKDSALDSSSSPPRMAPHVASHPASEPANGQHTESPLKLQRMISTSQHESASNLQKKVAGSLLTYKGEKINQSLLQSSSKVSNTLSHAVAPSNSPSTLSDEELALLLHQELNSSPRVPRVPRMRHAGSLPQLASPTAASGIMKRTSTGGKDHVLAFSRRKTKDLAKDAGQSFGEMDDEGKKMDTVSSPKDRRKHDSAFISDSVSKREADSGSASSLNSMKKSRRAASGSLSLTAEGNECSFSSSRLSPKVPSDEEKGGGSPVTHRTLPGLLAEIMSEGKRMTYEELCNSVLPHWPYLRKHNGERYAYSSHSQAVLDCLRNRNEWARLVDRGPKTSGGRKRRKADVGAESEDNDDDTGREQSTKVGSRSRRVEEFPKGKRKARKRKRLDLPKDVRRRRKADDMSDEKYGSLSDYSEETSLSEGEIQGSGISAGGNGASANSDGT